MIKNKIEFINLRIQNNNNLTDSNESDNRSDDIINLVNYNTIIASKKINDKTINLNIKKYSQTTSKNQNYIKRIATQKGYIIKEYI